MGEEPIRAAEMQQRFLAQLHPSHTSPPYFSHKWREVVELTSDVVPPLHSLLSLPKFRPAPLDPPVCPTHSLPLTLSLPSDQAYQRATEVTGRHCQAGH